MGSYGSSYSEMTWKRDKKGGGGESNEVMTAPRYPSGKKMRLEKCSGKTHF